jgi:hypothetical protein
MATKKKNLTKESVISMYMNYTLEHNEKPKSVYLFAKANNLDEDQFYTLFANLENVDKEIFKTFLVKTISLLELDENYQSYDLKNKMLSFYYTFFELLTANRSYVVFSLKENKRLLNSLMQLSSLRNGFKKYVSELIQNEKRFKIERFEALQDRTIQEAAWIQLLVTLKFWLDDDSAAFEKTDLFIEKSVTTTFELINPVALESLIDFGKFIFKEKIQHKL